NTLDDELNGLLDHQTHKVEFSDEVRNFMQILMTINVGTHLGANRAEEVKAHPFFKGIEWDKDTTTKAAFIPQVTDPELTDYFDPRGAIPRLFHDDYQLALSSQLATDSPNLTSLPSTHSIPNLPILKQANDDVIRKLKMDHLVPMTHTLSDLTNMHSGKQSDQKTISTNPPSPATSTSSLALSPSQASLPPSTPGSMASHACKPSEFGAVERFKLNYLDNSECRNSMPSRLQTASVSSAGDGSSSKNRPPSASQGSGQYEGPDPSDCAVTCLLAEDNPITAKMLETLLIRYGCRCVVVADGSEAISMAMRDIMHGKSAAQYIKSTNSKNTNSSIIAMSACSGVDANNLSNIFAASLTKPLQRTDLLAVMQKLGFKMSTVRGVSLAAKITSAPAS
ncbi:hypothetical protein SERLA73DRAFT_129494, partial [Serpula lacrymans var. lacrymans S7.3]